MLHGRSAARDGAGFGSPDHLQLATCLGAHAASTVAPVSPDEPRIHADLRHAIRDDNVSRRGWLRYTLHGATNQERPEQARCFEDSD